MYKGMETVKRSGIVGPIVTLVQVISDLFIIIPTLLK
jgi:hypothetical protein